MKPALTTDVLAAPGSFRFGTSSNLGEIFRITGTLPPKADFLSTAFATTTSVMSEWRPRAERRKRFIPVSSTQGSMKKGHAMMFHHNEAANGPNAVAIGIWENEGGAPGREPMNSLFGRRIEMDRSWTVYHVFTGVPARAGGDAMVGLSRSDATDGMMALNLRGTGRRKERIRLLALGQGASETEVCET